MQRILKICFFLLLLNAGVVSGQAHLRVNTIINWPDTVYNGQILPLGATVENIGTSAYTGPLQIILRTDSNVFSYIYYNQTTIFTINPGDTLSFFPPGGYLFDGSVFRPGNNVVVVWPHSSQALTVDTATFTTFFINNQSVGIDDPTKIPGLSVYPNPANEFALIWSPEIQLESVRIINSLGQEIRNENAGYTFKMNLSISDLPAGFYLLEIIGSGIHRSTIRLMKQD
jgi:hypothetical protein